MQTIPKNSFLFVGFEESVQLEHQKAKIINILQASDAAGPTDKQTDRQQALLASMDRSMFTLSAWE